MLFPIKMFSKNRKVMIEIQLQQRSHHGFFLNEENFLFLRMGRNNFFIGELTKSNDDYKSMMIILAFANHAVS